jgi:hypothetical protein
VLDDLVVGQVPATGERVQQIVDGEADVPPVPGGVQVEAMDLQGRSECLLVAGRGVGEGAVEVEDDGVDAGTDRGNAAARGSLMGAGRRIGGRVHAAAESAPQQMQRAGGPCQGSWRQPRLLPAPSIQARIMSAASYSSARRRSTIR